jgi:hypothetical protein
MAGLALSFANLVFLRVWFDLLAAAPLDLLHTKQGPLPVEYEAAIFNVVALAAVTFCALRFAARMPVWLRKVLVLVGALLCLNALRAVASTYTPLLRSGAFQYFSPKTVVAATGVLVIAGAVVLFRNFPAAVRAMNAVLMVCLPAVALTFISAAVRIKAGPVQLPEPKLAAQITPPPRADVRVVWVIFDEWDYRLSFEARPQGVALPVLDELASRSYMGTRVLAPQGRIPVTSMATQAAIPTLLAGALRGADSFAGPNVFSKAHARGWNVAIGGWYIPYCRLFAKETSRCYWDQMYRQSTEEAASFSGNVKLQNRSLFETQMFSLFGQSETSELHAAEYGAILEFAQKAESDPNNGLVYLHFNIPHAPYFYDAQSQRLDAAGRGMVAAYGDALMLVDRTVAKLEERLDPHTILILSADHPLRNAAQIDGVSDPRVPFLIHFPGQAQPVRDDMEFSAIKTASLVLGMLDGDVRTPEDADRLLTRNLR